jgi:hypothetical protein
MGGWGAKLKYMIYLVKKSDITLEIDDTVYFGDQPEEFRELFRQCETPDNPGTAIFDNSTAFINDSGRILFNVPIS